MAVLKGNISVLGPDGRYRTLTSGTERADLEAEVAGLAADGVEWPDATRILDVPGHWVDEHPRRRERENLVRKGGTNLGDAAKPGGTPDGVTETSVPARGRDRGGRPRKRASADAEG